MTCKRPLLWFARAAGVCLVRPLLRKFTCIPLPFYIRQTAFFLSPTGNLLPVVAITIYVSDSPLFPVAGKVGKRAVFDIRRKGNPKTIGFWRKLPKRRLWQIQQGGFEEVSRFSRHNVAGNRPTRRCVLLHTCCCCWQKVCRRRHKRRTPPAKGRTYPKHVKRPVSLTGNGPCSTFYSALGMDLLPALGTGNDDASLATGNPAISII